MRRVGHRESDRDRKVAKLVDYADCGGVASTDDQHDHEQVDVGVGSVIAPSDRAVEDHPLGTAALDNAIGDSGSPKGK